MLRPGSTSAAIGAAVSLLAAGCSGAPPTLPSLPQIAEALSFSELPVVGSPTEVYSRVARGVMACWFGMGGPLKANYIYHAEAAPASQGGKAEILIHERDRRSENPRGLRAFRIAITPQGEGTSLAVENLTFAEPLAKTMEEDVRRWASGSIGCVKTDGDWTPRPPETQDPKTWKTKSKKGQPA